MDVFIADTASMSSVRKFSNKKSKKLLLAEQSQETKDLSYQNSIRGDRPRPARPAGCSTWLKQLFAGQMGLSLLCNSMGLLAGIPLDLHMGWDATTRSGVSQLNQ